MRVHGTTQSSEHLNGPLPILQLFRDFFLATNLYNPHVSLIWVESEEGNLIWRVTGYSEN